MLSAIVVHRFADDDRQISDRITARGCAAKRRLDDAARIDANSVGIPYREPGYLLIGATSEAWRCAF